METNEPDRTQTETALARTLRTAADQSHPHLLVTLELAVPLCMGELRQLDPDTRHDTMVRWAREAVDPIASRSDVLLYGGGRGEAAAVFAHLVRALAAMALAPGGVTFAGRHWCDDHGACVTALPAR